MTEQLSTNPKLPVHSSPSSRPTTPSNHKSVLYVCEFVFVCRYVVPLFDEILLRPKKEWNIAICSNMYATRDYHTK